MNLFPQRVGVSFSGHESFPLRFPWLKKGFELIKADHRGFGNADAMVKLGVGKNMVAAIRHWGLTSGAFEEVDQSRGREVEPSDLGHALLEDSGWDPYLELIGTIWWLHWKVVTNPRRATAWGWLFSRPHGVRFSRTEAVAELEVIRDEAGIKKAPRSTLQRDVDVLIRSYCPQRSKKGRFAEESIDCPFAQLGLILPSPERGYYELARGVHPSLPHQVFLAAVVDYCFEVRCFQADRGPIRLINLDELLYEPNSPGRVFCLSDQAFLDLAVSVAQTYPRQVSLTETAGLRQLELSSSVQPAIQALQSYFEGALQGVQP